MSSYGEDIIRETFEKFGDAIGVQMQMPAAMITNLGAVLQAQIDLLAELQSTGRLLADDEMRLTAEQVEDVEALVATANPYSAPAARLRALFPATEPAEVNGNLSEIPNSSPAPAEPAEEETKAEGPSKFRKGDVEIQAMRVTPSNSIDVVNWVNGRPDAWREGYDGNAYPDMGGIEIPTSEGVKYVAWGNWVIKSVVGEFSLCVHSIFVNTFEPVPVSSPVVPAPTETGPWQTWEAVPDGVWYVSRDDVNATHYVNRDGLRYRGFDGAKSKNSDCEMSRLAPFVVAEEG